MVHFTLQEMERVMQNPDQVRNLSVIAHVDHGKSTLTDSLFAGAGFIRMDQAGNRRVTDDRNDEAARCITIKSTGISLLFPKTEHVSQETVMNVIDSPGHVDFSSEVTAALRATDGALVVVDCIEGVCVQTETVLRQALQELIQPVLVINKLDRFFLELYSTPEEIYQRLCRLIESVNVIISTYQGDTTEDFTIDPVKGNVVFAAGLMGWAFTLPQLAKFYSKRSNTKEGILKKLWGDCWVNSATGRTSHRPKKETDSEWTRGFCEFVVRPIQTVFSCCASDTVQWDVLDPLLPKLGVELKKEQRETLTPKELVKCVLQQWIPAHIALLDVSIHHLPSPRKAQAYRASQLYTGPLDDEVGQSIKTCDPNGPLVVYISKMAPERPNDRSSRFLAFGRVFSGTIRAGQSITILGGNYEFGQTTDVHHNVAISRVCAMIPKPVPVSCVTAGNTVAIVGLDKYISKTATLCNQFPMHPIKSMTFSVAPVVQRAVETKKPSDLPKLTQAMKQLSTGDSLVRCYQNQSSGEYIIAGAGELHLEICIGDLQNFMGDAQIVVKDPVVSYCETISSESDVFLAKSPNKHNRIFMKALPVNPDLVTDILDDKVDTTVKLPKLAKSLCRGYDWDSHEAKHLWGFFPADVRGTNCLVNDSFGVSYVNEIRDHVCSSLQWLVGSGPLIEGEMMGVRFSMTDATLHSDAIHRGAGQIMPSSRNAMKAAFLGASPRIMEPIYLVEIRCPRASVSGCHSVMGRRRAVIIEEAHSEGTDQVTLTANMPVAESFGFSQALRAATHGQAFPQMIFSHWEIVPGDPYVEGSLANKIVKEVRHSKGLSETLPQPEDFRDIL